MKAQVEQTSYEMACQFTHQHWPPHNREQGIHWDSVSLGLVARAGAELVGAATAKVVGGVAVLEQLVVAHGKTRQGVGTQLVRAFEQLAQQKECHVMELETAESQARPFYERLGFHVVCEKPNNKFGQTWYVLQKAVRPRDGQ